MEVELDNTFYTILSEDDGVLDGGSVEICVLATSCFERGFVVDLETSPVTAVHGMFWCMKCNAIIVNYRRR